MICQETLQYSGFCVAQILVCQRDHELFQIQAILLLAVILQEFYNLNVVALTPAHYVI